MSAQYRRNGSLLVAISLLSGFGSTALRLVATMWILDLTGSGSLAGLAGLFLFAPTLVAPWLGGLADRLPHLTLVTGVSLALAAVLPVLLLVRSHSQVALIFVVLLAYGIGYVLLDAGETALMPSVLPPAAFGTVNGLRSSAQEGTKLVAPLIGAGLYASRGGAAVAVLSSLLPLVVAGLYRLLCVDASAGSPRGDTSAPRRRGVKGTVALLWRLRPLRAPVAVAAVTIGASGFTNAAVLAMIDDRLRLPSTFLAVLATGQGAGSIAGGLVVGRALARTGPTAVASLGAALFAVGCVTWSLPWWQTMLAGSVVVGVGLPWTLVAGVTAVQTLVPPAALGRASATANTVMFGPLAVAIPLGAAAVAHLGGRPVLLTAAGCAVLAAAASTRSAPSDTARRDSVPQAR